jgi:hypothetical protein
MALALPADFKEFLSLLESRGVEYLLIGGYAVGFYGYPRATGDMDIWISQNAENARRMVEVLRAFGVSGDDLSEELFLVDGGMVRLGVPPLRLEIITHISGVSFADCYPRRTFQAVHDLTIPLINLDDLKANKKASGRAKDLDDLQHLP